MHESQGEGGVDLPRPTAGEPAAAEALVPLLYEELRALARAQLAREGEAQTLQPTALVHEAYMRLAGRSGARFDGRQHVFAAAARAMRHILVDRARARSRLKRGGAARRDDAALDALADSLERSDDEVLGLEEALEGLARHDPRKSEVVHLRYYLGLSVEETAAALGLSPTTVKSEWTFARAWLKREIDRGLQQAESGA